MNTRIYKMVENSGLHFCLSRGAPYPSVGLEEECETACRRFVEMVMTEVISTIYRSDISESKQEKLVQELSHKFGFKE